MLFSSLTANGLGIAEGGGFLAQKFNRRTNIEPCTNVQSKPFCPAFGNTLLAVRCFFWRRFIIKNDCTTAKRFGLYEFKRNFFADVFK